MRLGLDLAAAGAAPRFCPASARHQPRFRAISRKAPPASARAGSAAMSTCSCAKHRVRCGNRSRLRRPALAVMLLDVAVPPLALLVLLLLTGTARAGGYCSTSSLTSPAAVLHARARRIGDHSVRRRRWQWRGHASRGTSSRRASWPPVPLYVLGQAAALRTHAEARPDRVGAHATGRAQMSQRSLVKLTACISAGVLCDLLKSSS